MATVNVSDSDSGHFSDNGAFVTIHSGGGGGSTTRVGQLPGKLPGKFNGIVNTPSNVRLWLADNIPGDLPGSFNDYPISGSPDIEGVGWEILVRSGVDLSFLSVVPRYSSVNFMPELNDVGSGEIVLDLSDPIFNTTTAIGSPGTDILGYENIWEAYYLGQLVFQWFGETVDVMEVDASSEAQVVTVSGPGVAQMLEWAKVQPPGFPNIVYKLGAFTDTFASTGFDKPTLNTTLWNGTLVSDVTGGWVGVDSNAEGFIVARPLSTTGTPAALVARSYNATASYLSAKIMPLGQDTSPANLVTNGSFVLGTQGWTSGALTSVQNAGGLITSYTDDSEDGDFFSCLVVSSGGATLQGVGQQIVGLQPRTSYQVNAWVKIISGTPTVQLNTHDVTNGISQFAGTVTAVGVWTQVTATITTGSTANVALNISLNSGTPANTCQFLVDDVSCWRVDTNCHTEMSILHLADPNNNFVGMQLNWGSVFFASVCNAGVFTSIVLAYYDPIAHAYWRIRESNGVFYFDASPDGSTWQELGFVFHTWDTSSVAAAFAAWTDTPESVNNATVSSINGNVTLALQNTYVQVPNVGGVFLDLLKQAQARGTATLIVADFDETGDSGGAPWTDMVSMQVAPGGDLLAQLQASCAAVDADWVMTPDFTLLVGLPGTLGLDLSSSVVFYESGHVVTHEHLRVRDSISNYIVASDGTGNVVLATDSTSISTWNQREAYVETSAATDLNTLNAIAGATLAEFKSELSQRTVTIPPDLPGHTPFVDFSIGDWVGFQNTDLQTVDSVRVVAIAITIDAQENITIELTLETRIQLFVEQMNALVQKIGATANSKAITTPGSSSQKITGSSIGTGPTSYTQLVGDGASYSFTVVHLLNTTSLQVTVFNTTSGIAIPLVSSLTAVGQYALAYTSANVVTITFFGSAGTPPAPSLRQYTVVVTQ